MFPPIYLINLDRSTDRLSRVVPHLNAQGVPFQRYSAFDGKQLGVRTENPFLRDHGSDWWAPPLGDGTNPPFFCGAGVMGLALTYYALIKLGLMLGHDEMIVLEDDVVLCDDFATHYAAFRAELPNDYLYAHLGSSHRYYGDGKGGGVQQISERVALCQGACCTEAVLYSRRAMEAINARAKLHAPYDVFLIDDIARGQMTHIAHPFKLARQLSADGEIETTLS